ncbi:hypothetical protein NY2A_B687R [Paramecium bursaria Chlorella virus NY2A]|uniref:Uncharacterized protein B687R n=1 Tax=Paramecium bursaria Chlorella virus NY2A TaxID=46021 RepID=A7IXL2_PBCVN|nr:hypothetical protein NY2A_B687R [Paramecium bursaria Chlorella virus NY2A]ABT15086.1 hypothetical protein NY2A_B687R [Paramecium bursaria Chlorella virus NY2A]
MSTRKENVQFQNVKPKDIPLVDNPFSTYPYKHVITETQPTNAKDQAIWGLIQMGLSQEAARLYGDVVVQKTTRACRRSEGGFADVNTELWGTSPYLGLGDGVMFNTSTSNKLLRGFESSLRGSKVRTQIDDKSFIPYTWQTIDVPLAAAKTKFLVGEDTRQMLAYGMP